MLCKEKMAMSFGNPGVVILKKALSIYQMNLSSRRPRHKKLKI
jgi:hypothetical protein